MGGIDFFACTSHVSMYLHPGIVGWSVGWLVRPLGYFFKKPTNHPTDNT